MFLAETAEKAAGMLFGMTTDFWIIMIVFVLFLVSIWTSSYNDDKTKGL
jgi:high-affinity Fe2+/Pb2+ permease